ncbi:ankyrin repeat domain-containing protein 9 [Erpetoichthys calabaricus]|nr:ankyrin repeat domain-containing protein 9 [Polypterus senegalus]XP_051780974.1 ankyrin repeat domain-containing protein 9 [Erpetoichthys calabaricus]
MSCGSRDSRLQRDDDSRQRKFLSYVFYQAVRDHKPVWMLEDMRTMETFYWEENISQRTYSPSEALLYAVVHDHQAYAQYLLSHYSEKALEMPGERICCCPSSAPHLAMAVRYDRRDIISLILQVAHRLPSLRSYMNRRGCFHLEDGKTPLHVACELLRSEAVLLLLGSGASPQAEDHKGMTPLDVILEQLGESKVNVLPKKLCLDHLLMFMPKVHFKMKSTLLADSNSWKKVLGEDTFNYLVGRSPAPLFLIAMHTILQQLPPSQFPQSLQELPIPTQFKSLLTPFKRCTNLDVV